MVKLILIWILISQMTRLLMINVLKFIMIYTIVLRNLIWKSMKILLSLLNLVKLVLYIRIMLTLMTLNHQVISNSLILLAVLVLKVFVSVILLIFNSILNNSIDMVSLKSTQQTAKLALNVLVAALARFLEYVLLPEVCLTDAML